MTKTEHTPTFHMLDEKITKEQAFEIFREGFNSIKVMVYDDYMVYGDFEKRFANTLLETANALIRRKKLPLKATAKYLVTTATIIIEEI